MPSFHFITTSLLVLCAAFEARGLPPPFLRTEDTAKEPALDKSADHQPRTLQFVTSIFETIFPFYKPNQYPLHDVQDFNLYTVCTDVRNDGCTNRNVIKFTDAQNPVSRFAVI